MDRRKRPLSSSSDLSSEAEGEDGGRRKKRTGLGG